MGDQNNSAYLCDPSNQMQLLQRISDDCLRQTGFELIYDETMQQEVGHSKSLNITAFRTFIENNPSDLFDFAFDFLRLFGVRKWKLRGGLKLFLNICIGQKDQIILDDSINCNDIFALLKLTMLLTENNMFFEKFNLYDKNGEIRFVLIDNCYYSYLWNGITLKEIDEDEFDECMRVAGFEKKSSDEFELEPVDFYAFIADKKRTLAMDFVHDFTSDLLR